MALSPGTRLGPYEIVSMLGSGGMGEVYRAIDPRLGRDVAIKILPTAVARDPDRVRRFQQEARAIAALNHPNICQIYDVGPDYLVLEYIEGTPIQGPLPPDVARRLGSQVADALELAHKKGILHRDIKPANIVVTPDHNAKLLDFGLAKLLDAETGVLTTAAGTLVGTAAYMSPEQIEGQLIDARSDIFSVGAVLYEVLSGQRAFAGESIVEAINAVIHQDPPELRSGTGLDRVVMKCLAKAPRERFQTMTELKAALDQSSQNRAAATQPSIAVLPFADMSPGSDHEWFSDGLAEEIINALTHIRDLKVIARTSAFAFKDKHDDVRRIAETLGVTTVLEGSVRKAGDRLRVTAQLIAAEDGSHLWSERYDRDMADVFAIQDEIARAIASALEMKLSRAAGQRRRHTPSVAAYELLLKARHHMFSKYGVEAMTRSRKLFEEVITLDPQFAVAHAELAGCLFIHATENMIPAREAATLIAHAARRALQIDPVLPDARGMLALAAVLDYDWTEAGRLFQSAAGSDPVPPLVRYCHALWYLAPLGRMQEAEDEMTATLSEDPLNLLFRTTRGMFHLGRGNAAAGVAELLQVLELDEDFWIARMWLSAHLLIHERVAEALVHAEKAYSVAPANWGVIGFLAGLLMRTGEVSRANDLRQKLGSGDAYGAPAGFVSFHVALLEIDTAISWFEKAIAQRDTRAPWIYPKLFGDLLAASPRWPTVAKKMNLPSAA